MKSQTRSVVLGLAAPLLTNLPAQAVDYLQCREMLRTKNEMITIAEKTDKSYLEKSVYSKCPTMDRNNPNFRFDAVFDCLWDEKTIRTSVGHYYSPEAARWAKAAEKVTADMRKRQCPYE